MPVVETAKETEVFGGGFGSFGFIVNDIKASNLLLLSSQPEIIQKITVFQCL